MPLSRLKVIGPEPPSLCRQGPCSNYHEYRVQLDAATPMDGSSDVVHTQLSRSCYPTHGIEIDLDNAPVFSCSRWSPNQAAELSRALARGQFMKSDDGLRYQHDLGEWKADQARIAAEVKTYAEVELETKTALELLASQMDVGDVLQIRLRTTGAVVASVTRNEDTDVQLALAVVTDFMNSEPELKAASYQLRVLGADRETIKATSRYDHESPPAPKETIQ